MNDLNDVAGTKNELRCVRPLPQTSQAFKRDSPHAGAHFCFDLLFYHLRLRCFVVIDLKTEEFKPEFAGKMNFYLSTVDEQLRHPDDGPSIGVMLCKSRNELIVEYALRDAAKPMGVSQYRLATALPDQLQGELPTREDFSRELPSLPLVALRIEIERALWSFMALRGLEPRRDVGTIQALRELEESATGCSRSWIATGSTSRGLRRFAPPSNAP